MCIFSASALADKVGSCLRNARIFSELFSELSGLEFSQWEKRGGGERLQRKIPRVFFHPVLIALRLSLKHHVLTANPLIPWIREFDALFVIHVSLTLITNCLALKVSRIY